MTRTGSNIYPQYKLESSYGITTETNWKMFGHDVKITGLQINNNIKKFIGVGYHEPQTQVGGAFSGSIGLEYVLGDPWIFSAITGNIAVSSGSAPVTHTFINTGGSPASLAPMRTLTIDLNYDFSPASHNTITGAIITNMTLTCSVDEPVTVKLDMDYGGSTWTESSLATRVPNTDAAYTFAYGSVEFPTGTTLARVQSCEITFNRNAELKRGIGSRMPTFALTKGADWGVKITLPFDVKTLLQYTYGSATATSPAAVLSETATLRFVLNNGLTGASKRAITVVFTGVMIQTWDSSASVEDMMVSDVVFSVRQLTLLSAENNTATQPV